ncbi:MAG: hypothetical protein KAH46_30700 [Mycobacterium sp.]|nr:hypothetical protein [Mycobacterium sp.]
MRAFDFAKFLWHQRIIGFPVATEPHFDGNESKDWFVEALSQCHRYLEYGTGGSTYLAAQLGVPFVAVDSDKYFLRAVERKISAAGYRDQNQVFRYADIGFTGTWGRPLGRVDARRLAKFRSYSDIPPECFEGQFPDLVLVDGRFRVACALKVMKTLAECSPRWDVAVDDYAQRSEYHVLESYSTPTLVGRMAVFSRLSVSGQSLNLKSEIERWETVSA